MGQGVILRFAFRPRVPGGLRAGRWHPWPGVRVQFEPLPTGRSFPPPGHLRPGGTGMPGIGFQASLKVLMKSRLAWMPSLRPACAAKAFQATLSPAGSPGAPETVPGSNAASRPCAEFDVGIDHEIQNHRSRRFIGGAALLSGDSTARNARKGAFPSENPCIGGPMAQRGIRGRAPGSGASRQG